MWSFHNVLLPWEKKIKMTLDPYLYGAQLWQKVLWVIESVWHQMGLLHWIMLCQCCPSWKEAAIDCQHSCWRSCFRTSWLCCLQKFEVFIRGLEHRPPFTKVAKQAESTKSLAQRQCKKAVALSELGNPGKYCSTGACFCETMTHRSSCEGSGALNMRLVASDLFCGAWPTVSVKRDPIIHKICNSNNYS